jgi:drug/metabolite transporter (DMT)-like permease
MLVAGREATRELHVFQILEIRSLLGLVLLVPLIVGAGGWRVLRTARLPQHVGRNVVHYAAQFAWFVALTMIPIAQVVAIEFTMPIWTALLAAMFLGERLTGWKVAAVVLGMVGCAVIVRPHLGSVDPGQAIALACALGFAVSVILVKSLTRTEHVVSIMFWMLVVQSLLGAVPALLTWRTPSAQVWPWLVVIAICGTFSHYCMARALRHADATVVVPMDFLRVPLSAAAGWLVYAERLDAISVAGGALILAANALNLVRRPGTARGKPGGTA